MVIPIGLTKAVVASQTDMAMTCGNYNFPISGGVQEVNNHNILAEHFTAFVRTGRNWFFFQSSASIQIISIAALEDAVFALDLMWINQGAAG